MRFLPLFVWCSLAACGRVAASDAGSDAGLVPDGAEAGPCNPLPPTLPPGNCPQLDAICQQWASSAATYGVSVCYFDQTGSRTCQSPDNATCNGVVCMDGQVCSAPPNGPHQCVTACAGH